MRAIAQRVQGELIQKNGKAVLVLHDAKPAKDAPNLLYLRYAFVTLGREAPVFPAFLIDDWGAEVRGLKLYRWFKEHADEFPRAEVFGFEADGKETQCFLREFEHYVKLPCYAYQDRAQPVNEGVLLTAVLQPDSACHELTRGKRPFSTDITVPLRQAKVAWWCSPLMENYENSVMNIA